MTDEASYLDVTRTVYDTVAVDYERLLRDELSGKPLDRAMLAAYAEVVRNAGNGTVAELGCGPGRVTAHLRDLGLDVFGVDLSPGMIEVARARHPGIRFEVGSMMALDLADGSLAGVVAWYSTVHTPPALLPAVFAECHRVLAPGGHMLLGFKVGDQCWRRDGAYGHDVSFDVYWLPPEQVAELMAGAGLVVDARTIREPEPSELPSQGRQGFFLAHRPAPADA